MSEPPVQALQSALAAEHAAVWGYGLASAYLPASANSQINEAAAAHRARRDMTERTLLDAGVPPVTAEPGYLTPEPLTDAGSALRLAITLETDVAVAWRSVVEQGPAEPRTRSSALDALTGAAVRAARWRATAGSDQLTVPFPGVP